MATVVVQPGQLDRALRKLASKLGPTELYRSADARRFIPNAERRRRKRVRAETRRRKDSSKKGH